MFINQWPLYHRKEIRYNKRSTSFAWMGAVSMTIYQLECFIAVAEELNFSAAAQRLFTTQPAVTYQINTLEKETGLHLFDRTTRRTKLTAAGQSF